jgi:hypothetical protein
MFSAVLNANAKLTPFASDKSASLHKLHTSSGSDWEGVESRRMEYHYAQSKSEGTDQQHKVINEEKSPGSSTNEQDITLYQALRKVEHIHNTYESDKILNTSSNAKPFLLTVCTVVQNEVPYIIEWIEYMTIQGVDRFVIYDDRSTDNVTLINELYQQHDRAVKVNVLKAIAPFHQEPSLNHCLKTYGNTTVWMMVSDVDEFMYSPSHGTLKEMLLAFPHIEMQQNKSFNWIRAACLSSRYSTVLPNGVQQQNKFEYRIYKNANGRVVFENGCGLQLIMSHTRRGPEGRLSLAERQLESELLGSIEECHTRNLNYSDVIKVIGTCPPRECNKTDVSLCRWKGPGKSMFRPEEVLKSSVHEPEMWKTKGVEYHSSKTPLLWCRHYNLRSREDAYTKARILTFELVDNTFWSAVNDTSLYTTWKSQLVERMLNLTSLQGTCQHNETAI